MRSWFSWASGWRRLVALCLLVGSSLASAYTPPTFQGDVLDEAGVLSSEQQDVLRQRIAELRSKQGVWAAIYVTRGLQGGTIEEAAVSTFEKWKLGQKDKDNGLLVLIAPQERKMRIEVGYGLEGSITDVLSIRIIDDIYKPAFRENNYAQGLLAGFDAMSRVMRGEGMGSAMHGSAGSAGQETEFDGAIFLQRLFGVWLANLCIPVLYWLIQRRRANYKSDYSDKARTAFMMFAFIGFVFGLFFAVFTMAFPGDSEVTWGLLGGNGLFALVFSLPLVLSRRFSQGSSSLTEAGPGSSRWRSSSSSFSSDSGSSGSSSGGGRSGGGGASGDY